MRSFHRFVVAAFTLSILPLAAFAQTSIQLTPGQQRTINVRGASDIYVGDERVVSVKVQRDQRTGIITGLAAGTSEVTIIFPSGNKDTYLVEVFARDPGMLKREIRQTIGEIEGIEFVTVGGKIVARGEIVTVADRKRYERLLEVYTDIMDMVVDRTDRPMVGISASFLEVRDLSATDYNPNAGGILPRSDLSVTNTPSDTPIRLLKAGPFYAYKVTDDVLSRLGYFVTSGKADLVAQPKLTVADGDTATFVLGGEIPYGVQTRDGIQINWKEYGIKLKIRPQILGSGNVFLKLDAENSQLDPTVTVAGVPGLTKRTTTTEAVIERGQSVVLSGIYTTKSVSQVKRVPVLGYLLPFLFASISKDKEVVEHLVVVTATAPPDYSVGQFPLIMRRLKAK